MVHHNRCTGNPILLETTMFFFFLLLLLLLQWISTYAVSRRMFYALFASFVRLSFYFRYKHRRDRGSHCFQAQVLFLNTHEFFAGIRVNDFTCAHRRSVRQCTTCTPNGLMEPKPLFPLSTRQCCSVTCLSRKKPTQATFSTKVGLLFRSVYIKYYD